MSKQFSGKLCAYCCVADAVTGDHVFARKFFLEADRRDLPKAPICDACNSSKSALENYLMCLLPMAASNPEAKEHAESVLRRLERNNRLSRSTLSAAHKRWSPGPSGLLERRLVIPIEGEPIKRLFDLIARGLTWHHWRTYFAPDDRIHVCLIPDESDSVLRQEIYMRPEWQHVNRKLGSAVEYWGQQLPSAPQATLWQVRMYGGAEIASGLDPTPRICSSVVMVSAPPMEDAATSGA